MTKEPNGRSRILEDSAFVLGVVVAAGYVVFAEILKPDPGRAFPWGVMILVGACVAPKTLGRATAGRIWDRIAGKREA